jgi:hypothetical protein
MAVTLGVSFILLVFWSVLPELLAIALLGAGGLVTGSTALYAPSAFISILRAWSDPGS